MAKVIFKERMLDKDTRIEYPISTESVEVSDAFAARIKNADPKGLRAEIDGEDYESVQDIDASNVSEEDLARLKSKFEEMETEISDLNTSISILKEEKETILNERSHFETQLLEANEKIEQLESHALEAEATITRLNEVVLKGDDKEQVSEIKAEDSDSLFDVEKDAAVGEPKKAGRPKKTDD